MKLLVPAALLLVSTIASPTRAAEATLHVELNAIEALQNRCRVSFLIENKAPVALDSMKVDLAIFNPEGVINRRLIIELGPLRRAKTVLKTFELDSECGQIGSILINDVTACAPTEPSACLDQLDLSSRAKGVRLYK